jgi:hypothetical protein
MEKISLVLEKIPWKDWGIMEWALIGCVILIFGGVLLLWYNHERPDILNSLPEMVLRAPAISREIVGFALFVPTMAVLAPILIILVAGIIGGIFGVLLIIALPYLL